MRGAALIGKELDLSVQVQFAADEDLTDICFAADINYGETPVERSRITVSAQAGTQTNSQTLRVQSAARVDDAVVSVTLRTACGPKASRRYVLLSDVASEMAVAGAATSGANRPASLPNPNSVPNGAMGAGSELQTKAASTGAQGDAAKPAANSVRKPESQSSKPRAVKVAPLVASSAKGDKSRVEVSAAALEDLQKRVDDISKWQADNGTTEDAQKSEARAKALEAGIRDLQLLSAKNQKSIQLVAAAVEDASSQNYGQTLVYLLGALLLLCLAALAFVMKRLRNAGLEAEPWWTAGGDGSNARSPERMSAAAAARRQAPTVPAPLATEKMPLEPTTAKLPVALPQPSHDSGFDALSTVVTEHHSAPQPIAVVSTEKPKPARADFAQSGHGNLRAINTREMLDVRQQADFFMALGQHDEAVRLLESNIRGSADANPLVYLDLLKILHTLSRRADFDRYREEFNVQFTGRIPDYADFLMEGNGLEAYEDICHQIMVLWPTEYTVDFIEQCLVRLPEDDPEQGIDLEAFKDLLLLYGVLKRLDQFYDSSMAPFSASRSSSSQLASVDAVLADSAPAPLPTLPVTIAADAVAPVDAAIELDLNLDISGEQDQRQKHGNLIDFDVSSYTDTGRPELDK
jgi:hypothetical protein